MSRAVGLPAFIDRHGPCEQRPCRACGIKHSFAVTRPKTGGSRCVRDPGHVCLIIPWNVVHSGVQAARSAGGLRVAFGGAVWLQTWFANW